MHNLYGKRRLNALEVKGSFTLSNGMFCVWGNPADEGLSADIYDDSSKKLLIGMEHGILAGGIANDDKDVESSIRILLESFIDELEDSMVYYYGEKDSTFEKEDLTQPVPKKTGRFAK